MKYDPHPPAPAPASQARGSAARDRAQRWETRRHRGAEAARELRRLTTPAEETRWRAVRAGQLDGMRFRRQHPVGGYVVDFAIPEYRLGIELDGSVHDDQIEDDTRRTASLKELGYRIIRFSNDEVFDNLSGVLQQISAATRVSPRPARQVKEPGDEVRSPLACEAGEGGWGGEGR